MQTGLHCCKRTLVLDKRALNLYASDCNTRQHTAIHCNALQRTATHLEVMKCGCGMRWAQPALLQPTARHVSASEQREHGKKHVRVVWMCLFLCIQYTRLYHALVGLWRVSFCDIRTWKETRQSWMDATRKETRQSSMDVPLSLYSMFTTLPCASRSLSVMLYRTCIRVYVLHPVFNLHVSFREIYFWGVSFRV